MLACCLMRLRIGQFAEEWWNDINVICVTGTAASAPARSDNFALLDAKLARYGSAPAGPSQLPTNGLYQPSLPQKMGFAPGMAAAGFPTNGTGGCRMHCSFC